MAEDDKDRQRRLAEALRANLRRRKGQARERTHADGADAPQSADPSLKTEASGEDG